MQYGFVLHCCDVIALCTASQISNKYSYLLTYLLTYCTRPVHTYSGSISSFGQSQKIGFHDFNCVVTESALY